MSSTDPYLRLAKSVIPVLAVGAFLIVRSGSQGGIFIIPFLVVAVLAIAQAVRASGLIAGFSSHKKLRGSITETADRGHAVADDILDDH